MLLSSGLEINDPLKLLMAFARVVYPMYDGVPVLQDNELCVPDIALSIMLNSRISGNTGAEIWKIREAVGQGLARIPTDVDLLDVPKDGLATETIGGISQAI